MNFGESKQQHYIYKGRESVDHDITCDFMKKAEDFGEWLDLLSFEIRTGYILLYIKPRINFQYDSLHEK